MEVAQAVAAEVSSQIQGAVVTVDGSECEHSVRKSLEVTTRWENCEKFVCQVSGIVRELTIWITRE